jgi:hypothetical protein
VHLCVRHAGGQAGCFLRSRTTIQNFIAAAADVFDDGGVNIE